MSLFGVSWEDKNILSQMEKYILMSSGANAT